MDRGKSPCPNGRKISRISSGARESRSRTTGLGSVRPYHALRQSVLATVRRGAFLLFETRRFDGFTKALRREWPMPFDPQGLSGAGKSRSAHPGCVGWNRRGKPFRSPDGGEADTIESINGGRIFWEQVKRNGIDYIALYDVNEKGKRVQILGAEMAWVQ